MGLQLVLSLECHVAFLAARVVRADEVRTTEVHLQRLVVVIEHITVVLPAQVAPQMVTVEVLVKYSTIEEELLTKIAPWMRQDFCTSVTGGVSMLDVTPELLHVVDSLLADEHGAALEANQAESLLMGRFHVAAQAFLVGEGLLLAAIAD